MYNLLKYDMYKTVVQTINFRNWLCHNSLVDTEESGQVIEYQKVNYEWCIPLISLKNSGTWLLPP